MHKEQEVLRTHSERERKKEPPATKATQRKLFSLNMIAYIVQTDLVRIQLRAIIVSTLLQFSLYHINKSTVSYGFTFNQLQHGIVEETLNFVFSNIAAIDKIPGYLVASLEDLLHAFHKEFRIVMHLLTCRI